MNNTAASNANEAAKILDASKFVFVERGQEDLERKERPSFTFWQDVKGRLVKNRMAMVSLSILVLLSLTAIIAPFCSPHTYYEQVEPMRTYVKLPPRIPVLEKLGIFDGRDSQGVDVYAERGLEDEYFFFGTDTLARDQWSRTWYGVRISLYIGLLAVVINLCIGVTYGGIAGYYGGRVDNLMMRFTEIIGSIPDLVIMILFLLVFKPGIFTMSLAMVFTSWIGMARVTRGQVLKIKNQEYVMVSRTLGAKAYQIIFKHMLPNILPTIVVAITFNIPNAIFYEAFLAFIGLGLPAPAASLGVLINDGYNSLRTYPYMMLYPTLVLSLLMLCLNLFANGLRDAIDPTMRNK